MSICTKRQKKNAMHAGIKKEKTWGIQAMMNLSINKAAKTDKEPDWAQKAKKYVMEAKAKMGKEKEYDIVEELVQEQMRQRSESQQTNIDSSIQDLSNDEILGKPKILLCGKCKQECEGK